MYLRCLLVDDEPPALDVLESYIDMVDGLEVTSKCHNAVQAFSVLQETPVDLMFLDIKMPRLLGTDFLRSLRNPPKVIFTTAYRDYAIEGYELDIVDYLLKPIPFERFLRAVAKVRKSETLPLPTVEKEAGGQAKGTFLYFRVDRKMMKVFTREILYIESLKDYVKIITTTSKPLVVKQTITSVEDMLPENDFVRIHRSFIVAIDKISAYTPTHLDLSGQELPIGRLYQKEVGRVLKISL